MAAGAAGTELCPHCGRPFKRLRAHLPHCKAAPAAPAASPGPGPGSTARPVPSSARGSAARPSPASAPGAAPRSNPQPSATSGSAPEPSPAPHPRPAPATGPACPGTDPAAPGSGHDAVQDVARSLDLHPEEVEDVPQRLREGVKVVIEKHRARVVREKEPRSRGERTEPGPAPRKSAPKSRSKEAPSQGAAGSGSSKGGKSGLKATKTLREPAESSDSPGDLVQKKGRDKARAGGERVQMEAGERSEPPVCALHPRSLRLAPAEPIGAHGWGTAGNELGLPGLRGTAVPEPTVSTAPGLALQTQPVPSPGTAPGLALQTQPVPSPGTAPGLALQTQPVPSPGTAPGLALQTQPVPSPGTAPGLALPLTLQTQPRPSPALPLTPQTQPLCSARGLEWFPELYPESGGLRMFPGNRFHEDVRITVETARGGLAQGQQGPLADRPLMEVRLGELHTWISTCSFSAQGLLGAVQRAWGSYCAKYIHVKQGGPAGISMLLAGYCLLSYGWNYQHFKRHRWRKYH
ncbi:mitochondrial nucleoid-associated protein 1 [Zonotrichia leucophrys gambelii]|uniref:mitochondrial nucleoid-associated protein 1 n=1 Tax=Zonotrichia leucophrys gambelii TaxID=257770 RepID=UPI00314025AF